MATFTSKAAGNWSASGQTTWNEVGVPGDGDTVTLTHDVIIDTDTVVGSSPSTGGTAAIQFSGSAAQFSSLTVAAGITLTLKGDFISNGGSGTTHKLILGAGCTLKFLPPSGQQYKLTDGGDHGTWFESNGTSGARNTVYTDKSLGGLSCYIKSSVGCVSTYTDFTDLGTATVYGLDTRSLTLYPTTLTNCTFLRCNSRTTSHTNMTVDNAITDNVFTSSVTRTDTGFSDAHSISHNSGVTATLTISRNSFDGRMYLDFNDKMRFTGNYCPGGMIFDGSSSFTNKTYFANNAIRANDTNFLGPHTGNYFWCETTDNPHFIHMGVNAASNLVENAIFEATHNTGAITDQGDCVLSSSNDCVITGCISLPTYGAANRGAGKLFTLFGSTAGKLSAGHNTCYHGAAYSEDTNATAGDIPYFKDNLIWYDSAGMPKLARVGTGPTDVADPANVLNNAGWNTSATQNGYQGDWSVVPGSTDVSITSDPFVDKTRCLATWAAMKGQATTAAAAKALLAANPALITEADTGLLAWVRAGFKVTDPTLEDAGRDGVTIGAMGYVAAGGGRSGMNNRTLRPY